MKRILITGTNGFVGQNLCTKLQEIGGYDIIKTGGSATINLCDKVTVEKLPFCDLIVHLAAISYAPDSFLKPDLFYRNNIESTINMLEKARKDRASFIFLSTYVYGNPEYIPIDENHPVNPLNPYTQSKLICEDLCKAYNRDFSIPIIIFRPFNVYGKNQKANFFIPTILSQIQSETIFLKDPIPKRDFVHIDDLVSAIVLGIKNEFKGVEIYNIGFGQSFSVKEIVEMIVNVTSTKAKVVFTNEVRKGEVLDSVANISKAERKLGWTPKINIQVGLEKLL